MACWTADLSSLLTAASSLLGPLCRAAQCRWLYQSKQANIREREQAGRQASPSSVTYSWKWPPITSAASSWGVSSATLREFHASVALGCLHRSLHTAHAQAGFFVTCGVHMWKRERPLAASQCLPFTAWTSLWFALSCGSHADVALSLFQCPSLMYQELVWTGYLAALRSQKKPDPTESRRFRKSLNSSSVQSS